MGRLRSLPMGFLKSLHPYLSGDNSIASMSTKFSKNLVGVWYVHYQCPNCQSSLRSFLDKAGSRDHCPDCRKFFKVPGSAKKKEIAAKLQEEAQEREKESAFRRRQRGEKIKKAKSFVDDAVNRAVGDKTENERIKISNKLIIGRSAEKAGWLVPDPQVSESHAGVFWLDRRLNLIDLDSRIGTLLNDTKVEPNRVYGLSDDDLIRVGPAKFKVEGRSLRVVSKGYHAHLACRGVCKDVSSSNGNGTIRILNNVDLSIEAGTFVVLLGPSGSGKSTLLNALSGRTLATEGDVLLNQEDLYINFDRLKTRLATVPQKDLLHTELSLSSSLRYTADLRLPSDLTNSEKIERVSLVTQEVEMVDHANSKIATYSGGQLKRASLANELLSNPSLLFVDEATSGLDEHSDREIMAKMRHLADAGKTVVCITHNLGNVSKYAHKLVVMANGGYVAFVGRPAETLHYFSIDSLSDLYIRLKEKPGKEWAKQFDRKRMLERPLTLQKSGGGNQIQIQRKSTSLTRKFKTGYKHFNVILRRTAELQFKDKNSLALAVSLPIFVFLLIWIVFGSISKEPGIANQTQIASGLSVIFLLGISSFWFGCSNSAKEIVKERELFEREKNAGLSPFGYLASKVMFLFGLTMLQSWFLLIAVKVVTDLDGSLFLYGLSVSATAICGVSLGLAISVMSASTDVASTAVPLAIIPQVILAGMIKRLEDFPEYIAWFTAPSYWCFGSMSHVWNDLWYGELNTEGMLAQQEFGLSLFALGLFTTFFFSICGLGLSGLTIPYLRSKKQVPSHAK